MKNKKIIYLSLALFVIALGLFVLSRLNISFGTLVKRVDFKKEAAFKNFTVEDAKMGSDYVLKFRNLTAGTNDTEQRFFKVDITIVLKDKNSQKVISHNSKVAGAVISNTMGNFKVSDVNTPKGKQFLKSTIQKNLENKFGENSIKEIYFENFIYN